MKILRRRAVIEKTGLSRDTIRRFVRDGRFPAPVGLGPNSIGWVEDEVDQWVRDRAAERDSKRTAVAPGAA